MQRLIGNLGVVSDKPTIYDARGQARIWPNALIHGYNQAGQLVYAARKKKGGWIPLMVRTGMPVTFQIEPDA